MENSKLATCKEHVKKYSLPNGDNFGTTALMLASANLLPTSLDVDYGDHIGVFRRIKILRKGDSFTVLEQILQYLIKVYDVNQKDNFGSNVLHYAVRSYKKTAYTVMNCWMYSIIKFLVKTTKVNINAQDNRGRTVLHYLIKHYSKKYFLHDETKKNTIIKTINYLFNIGADVHIRCIKGRTVLHTFLHSCYGNDTDDIDMLKTILDHDSNIQSKINRRGIPYLLKREHIVGNRGILSYLIHSKNRNMVTFFKILVKYGADVKAIDSNGNTLIHDAICRIDDEDLIDIITILLEQGVDINRKNNEGFTCIQYARTYKSVKFLIDHGAKFDYLHFNPVINIIKRGFGGNNIDKETVTYLINKGVDVNRPDRFGRTPIFYTPFDSLKIFLDMSTTELNIIDKDGNSPLLYNSTCGPEGRLLLVEKGMSQLQRNVQPGAPKSRGMSQLQHNVQPSAPKSRGMSQLQRNVLPSAPKSRGMSQLQRNVQRNVQPSAPKSRGADITLQNNKGQTIFHKIQDNSEIIKKFVKIAQERGMDINTPDYEGNTPIHTNFCSTDSIKIFLENGCHIDCVNKNGETPLLLETRNLNCIKCFKLFRSLGCDINIERFNFAPNRWRTFLEMFIKKMWDYEDGSENGNWASNTLGTWLGWLLKKGAKTFDYYRSLVFSNLEKYKDDPVIQEYIEFTEYFDVLKSDGKFLRRGYGSDKSMTKYKTEQYGKEREIAKVERIQELFNKKTLVVRSIMIIYLNRKLFSANTIEMLPHDIRKYFDLELFKPGYKKKVKRKCGTYIRPKRKRRYKDYDCEQYYFLPYIEGKSEKYVSLEYRLS